MGQGDTIANACTTHTLSSHQTVEYRCLINVLVLLGSDISDDLKNSLFTITLNRTLGAVQTYDGLYIHA